ASLGQAVEAIDAARRDINLPAAITGSFQGNAQAFKTALASEPYLVAAAVFVIYIILGMLYERYIHPITILSTLPSAGLGALFPPCLFGQGMLALCLSCTLSLCGY